MNTPVADKAANGGKFRLSTRELPSWPKLSWVARCPAGCETVTVYHGPMVETSDQWAVEAVWVGPFEEGGFDRTDLVFGTGVRLRDNDVVFVASGTVFDRLWHCRKDDSVFVSNSLPALLAVTGVQLIHGEDYVSRLRTAAGGLGIYERILPAARTQVELTYHDNLLWDGRSLDRVPKPTGSLSFGNFEVYKQFLVRSAESIGHNVVSPGRTFPVGVLASVSSGYDSGVASWAARRMGARRAVTIRKSNSLWRGSDSGEIVAEALDLKCEPYPLWPRDYPNEMAIWAATGMAFEMNWTQFRFEQPVCLFCTGCHGDRVWAIDSPSDRPFSSPSLAGIGITEWRLGAGVLHCPVPVWGIGGIGDLRRISQSEEMSPWRLGGDYDRPIPRRILESAGVSRRAFGQRKKNTQSPARLQWPISQEAHESYAAWRARRGLPVAGLRKIRWLRGLVSMDNLARANIHRYARMPTRLRAWQKYSDPSEVFHWANETLRDRYAAGLAESGFEAGA